MRHCDVLVIGGGPAGSTCARRLRQHGLDVLVLDKASFPRDKVCAGWITPQVVESLELDLADYARERVLQPIRGFRTGLVGERPLANRYEEPVSYAIRRCEFDHYLLQRSGAELLTGQALKQLERDGDTWIANDGIRAPMLVGAGGHTCPVARRLSTRPPGDLLVVAQEAEIPLDPQQMPAVEADTPELYFAPDLKGYGWCIRKEGWINVGLGRADPRRLGSQVEDFVEWLHQAGRIPRLPPHRLKGHAYLLHGHASRPLTGDGVLLIGDAAGLAYVQSGEGIRPAVESGLLAAEVIAGCRPDFRARKLDAYRESLSQRLGEPRRLPMPTSSRLHKTLGVLLLGNRLLTRKLLLDRWFLHRSEPALRAADASLASENAG